MQNSLSHRFFILIMLLGIFLYSPIFFAAEVKAPANTEKAVAHQVIAQVVWVKGEVTATGTDKKVRELKRRDLVYLQDTINTGKNGTGQIVFTDSSLLSLRENTSFVVNQYKFTNGKAHDEDKFVAGVAKGGFRTITGAISKDKPENYKVVTPVATIGVRGTQYVVSLGQNGGVDVKIETGAINVVNPAGSVVLTPATSAYASITSVTQSPRVSNTPPPTFQNPPSITPAKPSTELQRAAVTSVSTAPPPGGNTGGGASSSGTGGASSSGTTTTGTTSAPSGGSSGGSKTVSNFCIS